ncbi:MAG TPA: glutamine-hydrolyzing carbamoyl-phosphate synthase small subunit [Acidimicrobiia bacterium]|nr:glutamine-hydrolyzing carbamoyl-phosphate synthase small subunit [Acidimicrobiia bacterium]
MRSALLVTADGAEFPGVAVGAEGVATGEAVFNTAMTGYQEVITDPSYAEQIVVMTSPHIGNYGVTPDDDQAAAPWCAGLVVRSLSRLASGTRATGRLDDYLAERGVVGLAEVDTRRLTRHVRSRGAMPAAMGCDVDAAELKALARAAPDMVGRDLASRVGTPKPYFVPPVGERRATVAAFDFGIKRAILDQLTLRGCGVHVLPAGTPPDDVLAIGPDGVFLSNGPGDPEPLAGPIATVETLLGRLPMFGICLGHQVMGLALGASTYKLPFGHHGANHPVRRLVEGGIEITSQNHGFAVDLWVLADHPRPDTPEGLPGPDLLPVSVESRFGEVVATHQNLNDGTLEGLRCRDVPAFSVQYHPEAAPGPHDARGLFGRFMDLMGVGVAPAR